MYEIKLITIVINCLSSFKLNLFCFNRNCSIINRNCSSGFSGIKKKKKEEEVEQIRLGQHVTHLKHDSTRRDIGIYFFT